MKVLLVDQDEVGRDVARLFLQRSEDILVRCVSNGSQALDALISDRFDAIVSEMDLPEMGGLELLRSIRGMSMETPFIFFTKRSRDEMLIRAFAKGADFFIVKGEDPVVQFKELENAIRKAIAANQVHQRSTTDQLMVKRMFDIIPEPLMLIENGRIRDCNSTMVEWVGYPKYKLSGQDPSDMLGFGESSSMMADALSQLKPVTPLTIQDSNGRSHRCQLHVMDMGLPSTDMRLASFQILNELSDEGCPDLEVIEMICQALELDVTVLDPQGRLIRSSRACTGGSPMTLDESIATDSLTNLSMVLMADGSQGLAIRVRSDSGGVWAVIGGCPLKTSFEHHGMAASSLPTDAEGGMEHLLDGLQEGVVRLVEGRLVWANRAAESLLRLDRSSDTMKHLEGTILKDAGGNQIGLDELIGYASNGAGGLYELVHEGGVRWLYSYMVGTCDDGALIISDRTVTVVAEQRAYIGENLLDFATRGVDLTLFEYDITSGKAIHDPLLPNKLGYDLEEFDQILQREGIMGLVNMLIPPDKLSEFMGQLEGFLSSDEVSMDAMVPLIHKRGHCQWWRAIIKVTARDDDGKPLRLRGLAIDTTLMKQYQDALESVNKKMRLLDSITRHDILNKMTVLTGYMVLMGQSLEDVSLSKEYLSRMRENARMIQKYLEFTREYRTMGMDAPRWQDLQYAIMAAWDPKSTLGLHISPDVPEYQVYADPMLVKVFENLFNNVSIHSAGAEHVKVELERTPSSLIIRVIDDGQGVPERNKERIFNRGFGKNTGFGLFLAREIMGITGASIAEVGREGEGAIFEITFPAASVRGVEWN